MTNEIEALAAQFFGRVNDLGVPADNGNVQFVCTRSERGLHVISLLLQVGPDVAPVKMKQPSTDLTLAFQFQLKEAGIDPEGFLRRLIQGSLVTPGGTYKLSQASITTTGIPGRIDDTAALANQQRWMTLDIPIVSEPGEVDDRTTWRLRADTEPFDGIQDLQSEFGVLGLEFQVRVVMSILAMVDGSSAIEGTTATVRVRLAEGLEKQDFRLGYRVFLRNGVRERASLHGGAFAWSQPSGAKYWLGEVSFEVPRASALQCYAVYRDRAFHYWWVGDKQSPHNFRRALYQIYDGELAAISEALSKQPRRGKSKAVEAAVAQLMWILGCSPIHIGENGPSDVPDVIAVTPNGNIIVVECTTGGLRSDNKLQNLLDRVKEVREQLVMSDLGYLRVLPLFVTTRTRQEVQIEISEFAKFGVLVATQEDLLDAIQRSIASQDADDIFHQFESFLSDLREMLVVSGNSNVGLEPEVQLCTSTQLKLSGRGQTLGGFLACNPLHSPSAGCPVCGSNFSLGPMRFSLGAVPVPGRGLV